MFFKRALALVVVALALPYACAPIYRFAAPRPFAGHRLFNPYAGLHGRWLRANLHAHGRAWYGLTNGRQHDREVIQAYRDHGYDIAGISDYFHIAAHEGVPSMPLYEHGLNIGKHHQVAIGARSVAWFDLPLWQGVSQKQYVIDRVKASAELVALAHPSIMPGGYSPSDLAALTGYDLFEVVNGRFAADQLWDDALSAGHAVWAIGDDDTHDVTDPNRMAVAWNMIDAPSTSDADVIAALRSGRMYVVSRQHDAPDATDARLASLTLDGGTLVVTLTAPASVSFIGQNGRELRTALNTTTASYPIAASDTYVRTVVRTPHTVLYLNPVVRYDGRDLATAAPTIDEPMTWTLRAAIAIGCVALIAAVFRRRAGRAGRTRASLRRASSFVLLLALGTVRPARAQTVPRPAVQPAAVPPADAQPENTPEPESIGQGPALGSTLTFDLLRDLPTGGTLYSILETTQAEIISDRFSNGGVNYGTATRVGAFGSSWTQTMYRIGDVDVTDGAAGGTPLFFPEVAWWRRVTLASAVMPADIDTPGAAVTLEPRRPTDTWVRDASVSTSFGDLLTSQRTGLAPAIAAPANWNRGTVTVSGPLVPGRAGVFVAGSWTGTSQYDGASPFTSSASVGSAFANLQFTPTDRDDLSTVAILQHDSSPDPSGVLFTATSPQRDDTSVHVQSTWQRRGDEGSGWRAFGSFTQRSGSDANAPYTSTAVDSLLAGPIPSLVDTGARTDRRWSLGARAATAPRVFGNTNHTARAGIDLTGASDAVAPGYGGAIGELVSGVPARVWQYTPGATDMRHHLTTLALFASDRIEVPSRLLFDFAVRYEHVSGAADGAATGIGWNSILPRASVRWSFADRFGASLFAAYTRTAYRLPLDDLAWGDPSAPTAAISQWGGGLPPVPGALVGRWGPGTGGDPAFSRIDPNLKRPYSDDVSFGVDAHPFRAVRVQLAAVGKWERELMGVVNASTAAPLYSIVGVPDPGLDLATGATSQTLPVSNLVLTPGVPYRYDYTLTNPSGNTARLLGVRFSAEARTDKLFVLLGATAHMAEGVAGWQGYGPGQNDQGLVGDTFVNPNATLFDRGRLFFDRAFTIKLTTIYTFPWDVRVGAIARYQDGQPFARLVLVPDLNQGAEAVRAFENGLSRFTFTGTLDVRLQKEIAAGGHHVAIVLDGYNIVNMGNEVAEDVFTGPAFRTPTLIQPPLTIHLGARISF